jgi:hypothetical protein
MNRLRKWLLSIAWPTYDCEDCIGMVEHGCQCAVYDAIKPGGPGPEPWRMALRKALTAIGWGWAWHIVP